MCCVFIGIDNVGERLVQLGGELRLDHQFFCKVDEEYIRDSFNLYGLKQMFDHYKYPHPHPATPSK
jgi:hypothetical protein